ncbi:MAG: EamA family transporter [Bryobacteraceae bacterium]
MTITAIFLILLICGSTSGEIAIARGSKEVGEPASLRPLELLRFLGKVMRTRWLMLGIVLMAISFYALLLLLSWQPVSFVIPASALSYVVGTVGAKYVLHEEISGSRWAGVLLVCIGVALVAKG